MVAFPYCFSVLQSFDFLSFYTKESTVPKRNANATWNGTLKEGNGTMSLGSGAFEGAFSFSTRFEEEPGTNPEELVGAALAGCFSMALSASLEKEGFTPVSVETTSVTTVENPGDGFAITSIALNTNARVKDISDTDFQRLANATKSGCPVSKALTGTSISLDAKLL